MPTDADPGLARERTALAWNRSGLAVVVCVAVVLRHLWPLAGAARLAALGVIAGVAVGWALALLVFPLDRSTRNRRTPAGGRAFAFVTAGTLTLAVIAIVLSLLSPG